MNNGNDLFAVILKIIQPFILLYLSLSQLESNEMK